ncbi:MAG: tryptophan--tRNA ligase [Firmicutes bacterium]|nr:tryptophan--tRNA ligase [Bacillota bacterium]
MKRVFSGVQPSGNLTLGNYIGALRQFVALQHQHDCLFCVVDLHALTVPQEPSVLREKTEEVAGLILASGLDPAKVTLFIQSHVPAHAELCWLLNGVTYVGELSRMTQYKDKAREKKVVTAGLLNYPILMAADILLYGTDLVPVGADQKQHLELSRDLAIRFNNRFGPTFTVPEPLIPKVGAKIAALTDPTKKMSKSSEDPNSYVALLDPPDVVAGKIARAVTDSGREVRYAPREKPGVSNLLTIYALCRGVPVKKTEEEFAGSGYADLKKAVAEAVIETLRPIQARYRELRASGELREILAAGRRRAEELAAPTLRLVKERMGLVTAL